MTRNLTINYAKIKGDIRLTPPVVPGAPWTLNADYVVGSRDGEGYQDIPHAAHVPVAVTQNGYVAQVSVPFDWRRGAGSVRDLYAQIREQEHLKHAEDEISPELPAAARERGKK